MLSVRYNRVFLSKAKFCKFLINRYSAETTTETAAEKQTFAEAARENIPPLTTSKEASASTSNIVLKYGNALTDLKTPLSFDEVPGPPVLRTLSKVWTVVPVFSNQVTASTIQYMLSAGKIFGSQLSFGNNLWMFRWLMDEYGPVVRLHGPFGGDVVILSRPEHVSVVFENEGPHPIRSSLDCVEKYRLQHRKFAQAGPFVMHGMQWETLRKAIEEPMQKYVTRQFDKLESVCDEMVLHILNNRNRQLEMPPNFIKDIYKWTMECLTMMLLNQKFGFLDAHGLSSTSEPAILLDDLRGATDAIRKCEYGLHMWKFFETRSWKSLVRHCDSIDAILGRHVKKFQDKLRERKEKDLQVEDVSLVECLLLKEGMTPEDVLTVLLDMFLIGVNMTVHTVTHMIYHLAKNPRAQHKLYEEIRNAPEKLSKDKMMELPYLSACLKESLRLKPPMPVLSRILTKDITVYGYKIPKGTYILIATHLSSLREEHFEDATKYKPERWLDNDSKDMEILASIPFGHGPKACLAKELAETQICLLMLKLIRRYRIEYHYGDIASSNKLLETPTRPLKFRFVDH